VVELDGGTLVLGGEESLSVCCAWCRGGRGRCAGVGGVVSGLSGVSPGASADPDCAVAVPHAGPGRIRARDPEPTMLFQCGGRTVPSRQRLDAVAVVAERECRLSALQRLAVVDVAASPTHPAIRT
jgi:hypothetical protein